MRLRGCNERARKHRRARADDFVKLAELWYVDKP
jgi:hypothetical protein